MKILSAATIKTQIPTDTLLYRRLDTHQEDDVDIKVLLIEGDFQVADLNLDEVGSCISGLTEVLESISAIICTGNLIANNIYNHDDDGSCSLIVLGDMSCEHMIVGGQEIYVRGNLNIKECFWGNYNHGVLRVGGYTKSRVFVVSEEYNYLLDKTRFETECFLSDDEENNLDQIYDVEKLENYFQPEYIVEEIRLSYEPSSWNDWLNRNDIIEAITNNHSILQDIFGTNKQPKVEYTKYFKTPPEYIKSQGDWYSESENFLKLLDMAAHEPDNVLEFEKYGWVFSLEKTVKKYAGVSRIIAYNEDMIVSIAIEKVEKESFLKKEPVYEMSVYVRERKEEEGIHIFEEEAPESYYQAFNNVWKMLLYHAERGFYFYYQFLHEVTGTEIYNLCTLPVVTEHFNDWRDGSKNGFYFGGEKYSMCIPCEYNGSAQLRISKKIKSKYDTFDCRAYRFDTDTIENPKKVSLLYNYSQNEKIEGRYRRYSGTKVYFFDDELYEEALDWYRKARVNIPKKNEEYLRFKKAFPEEEYN